MADLPRDQNREASLTAFTTPGGGREVFSLPPALTLKASGTAHQKCAVLRHR